MTRLDICEHVKSPLLGNIVKGSFVRVVSANNTYRLCRVITTTKAKGPYDVITNKKRVKTNVMLLCAVGGHRKQL